MLPKKPRASLAANAHPHPANFARTLNHLHGDRQEGFHSPGLHRSPANKENVAANRADIEQ